jgi:hypothetical protein
VESLVSEPRAAIGFEHWGFTADGEFVEKLANIRVIIFKCKKIHQLKYNKTDHKTYLILSVL